MGVTRISIALTPVVRLSKQLVSSRTLSLNANLAVSTVTRHRLSKVCSWNLHRVRFGAMCCSSYGWSTLVYIQTQGGIEPTRLPCQVGGHQTTSRPTNAARSVHSLIRGGTEKPPVCCRPIRRSRRCPYLQIDLFSQRADHALNRHAGWRSYPAPPRREQTSSTLRLFAIILHLECADLNPIYLSIVASLTYRRGDQNLSPVTLYLLAGSY